MQHGLIAILDALGASEYSEKEIDTFLESRNLVLKQFGEPSFIGKVPLERIKVFTFNDSVIIAYLAEPERLVNLKEIEWFAFQLRRFTLHSLENRILFRGALSIGRFHRIDDETNTVLGAAVSDAAAWYNRTDWIGVSATPYASMYVESLIKDRTLDHILVDYDVPMKGNTTLQLKAINWPKGFYVEGIRPNLPGSARSMLLKFLTQHRVPVGTELKYRNTVRFFDHIYKAQIEGKEQGIADPGGISLSKPAPGGPAKP